MHVNTRYSLLHAYIYSTDVLYNLCSSAILNSLFLAVGKELDSPPPLEIGSPIHYGYGYPMLQGSSANLPEGGICVYTHLCAYLTMLPVRTLAR